MAFVFRAVDEVGAALNAALVVMGDQLGYYRGLAERRARPRRAELAERTSTERALRAGVAQRPGRRRLRRPTTRRRGRYTLPAEHAVALDRRDQPRVPARRSSRSPTAPCRDAAAIIEAARSGDGRRLARAQPDVHVGLRAVLPPELPRAPGRRVAARRSTASSTSSTPGAPVADVGCGHGASTDPDGRRPSRARRSSAPTTTPASIETARAAGRGGRRRRPRSTLRGRAGRRVHRRPATTW